jgi:malate dehydrogenase (oxaloacetate-decarboxylating)(NADP+)
MGLIYPPQSDILETSIHVATNVAELIFDRSLAGVPRPASVADFIRSKLYQPEYHSIV